MWKFLFALAFLQLASADLRNQKNYCYATPESSTKYKIVEVAPDEVNQKLITLGDYCYNLNLKPNQVIESDLFINSEPREIILSNNKKQLEINLHLDNSQELEIKILDIDIEIVKQTILDRKLVFNFE